MRLIVRCSLVGVTAMGLAACGQGNQYVEPPPAKVVVTTPVKKTEVRYLETTGNDSSCRRNVFAS